MPATGQKSGGQIHELWFSNYKSMNLKIEARVQLLIWRKVWQEFGFQIWHNFELKSEEKKGRIRSRAQPRHAAACCCSSYGGNACHVPRKHQHTAEPISQAPVLPPQPLNRAPPSSLPRVVVVLGGRRVWSTWSGVCGIIWKSPGDRWNLWACSCCWRGFWRY